MGLFSRFESKAESVIEGSASSGKGGIEPVKLAKRAFKEMQREKMVGVGNEYAPTLYNVLVSEEDDTKMSGYYPSLAGEIETYLSGKAKSAGLVFDCQPLVRFIVDDGLKRGRFDIIAENVSPAIIAELRDEEMEHYGIKEPKRSYDEAAYQAPFGTDAPSAQPEPVASNAGGVLNSGYQPDYEPSYTPPAAAEQPATHDFAAEQPVAEQPAPHNPAAESAPASEEPQAQTPYDAPSSYEQAPGVPIASPVQPAASRTYPPTEAPASGYASIEASAPASADKTVFLGNAAPAAPRAALFEFATQVRHPVNAERTIIGRGTACDIVISNPSVSRHHAEIVHDESGWLIRDTGSTNGTNVNGGRASQSRIYNGDIITLGTTELEFQEG